MTEKLSDRRKGQESMPMAESEPIGRRPQSTGLLRTWCIAIMAIALLIASSVLAALGLSRTL
jgi:hypothetical protein